LLDDWVQAADRGNFDRDGTLAAAGSVDQETLDALLGNRFFDRPPPKSLDRYDIAPAALYRQLSWADGAATLTAFSAAAVARGLAHLPALPKAIWVCGGGRLNPVLMAAIAAATGVRTEPVEALGCNGDLLEAELFAFLALRHLQQLPLSYPTTTGVAHACCGGTYFAVAPEA
jgi:anhydro-N-acetylmuramic acid kinase